MLEKIISIDNIGVIKNGVTKALNLRKVTLIYADNARGKSTFSALMSACARGDAAELVRRNTIGNVTAQKVILRFKSPKGDFTTTFDGKNWTGSVPNLHVFNQDFVERNVYASGVVSAEQRASLLELALGDSAVIQRAEFQTQSNLQRACASKVSAAEGTLTGFRGVLSVDRFIALAEIDDADAQIQVLDKQTAEAQGAAQTLVKPEFKKLTAPNFNLDDFKAIALSEFEQVQDGADALVKKHFAAHLGNETERWASHGLQHKLEQDCPFCGQEAEGVVLLAAYKTYFNQAYKKHLASVATMKQLAIQSVSSTVLSDWAGILAFNNGAVGNWAGVFKFALPTINLNNPKIIVGVAQQMLLTLAERKITKPLETIGLEMIDDVVEQLKAVTTMVDTFNTQIDGINQQIADYKKSLVGSDINALAAKRTTLVLQMVRHDAKVKPLVDAVTTARAEYKAAETAKDTARVQLEMLMEQLLAKFQNEINAWLMKFGAPFKLKELKPTYLGGGVRSQYVIEVRGVEVPVGPAVPGSLSFHSALSEGDKRTLAFAFFLAKLFADPNRENAVVVLDDVFTSLDHHRRHNTADAAVKIAHECAQVIALGHDAHFLRELKKRAENKKLGSPLELCLHRDADNYSLLADFDLDEFCASDYYKHYVLVVQFNAGSVPPGQYLDVAKALRLLVEGHLHRCFPGYFKEGQTVGVALDAVKNANENSPLVALQPLHADLVNFNEYAAAYHHDTSGGHTRTDISDAELLHYAKAAIGFIQARKLW